MNHPKLKYGAPLKKLTLGVGSGILPTAVWVSENNGYFKKEGLDITIKGFDSGKLSFLAMLRGEVDISTVAPTPIIFNSFDRQDFSIISTFVHSYDDIKVIVRHDKGINTAADLKGKRIGTPAGTSGQFFLDVFLIHNGIVASEVEVVDIAPSDLPGALKDNRVDAIVIWEPHGHKAQQLLKDSAIRLPSSDVYRRTFNFMAMKDFARKNTEVFKRFLRSIDQASQFIRNNKERSQAIVAKRLNMDKESINALWDNFVFELSLDQSLVITLEEVARWAIQNNLTNKKEVPNYLDYIYVDALKVVKPEAVGMYTMPVNKVTIAEGSQPIAGPVYVAFAKGYFKEAGLEVTLQPHTSGKACLNAVTTGKADLATTGDFPIMYAVLKKNKIYAIATIEKTNKNHSIVVKKDNGISKPHHLKGKKIGVTLGTGGEYFLDSFLLMHEIIRDEVEVVNLRPENMVAALLNDEVDAVATWNPHVIRLQKELGDKGILFYGEGIYTATYNIAARQDFVNKNQETIKKVLQTLIKATEFISQNPGEARRIISAAIHMDLDLLEELWDIYHFAVTLDQSLLLTLEDEARWAIKNQLTDGTDVPDYLNYIYLKALQAVKPEAVGITF